MIFSPSVTNTSLRCGIALNAILLIAKLLLLILKLDCGLELPNSGPDVMTWTLHVVVDGLGLALRSVSSRSSPSLDFCLPNAGSDVAIVYK